MSERIDATDQQIADGFDELRRGLHLLPNQLDFLTDIFQAAIKVAMDCNGGARGREIVDAAFEELAEYRDQVCEALRAAMRLARAFDVDMANCARLASALDSIAADKPDYKQFVFEAQVELDRMRAMFEREAEKGKPPAPETDPLFALYNRMKQAAGKGHKKVTDAHVAESYFDTIDKAEVSKRFRAGETRESIVAEFVTKLRNCRSKHPKRLWSPND